MSIVETFGNEVGEMAAKDAKKARSLMLWGYLFQEYRLKWFPDRRLPKSKQYLSWLIMRYMRKVLRHPEQSAMTSLFIPCEPLLAIGYAPYSAEGISAFMTGTRCQNQLLDAENEDQGLCSYHRIFLGGTRLGLLPRPPFLIYTNVACDANMITFPHFSRKYHVPRCFIDVPYELSQESVHYVAKQLQQMVHFIEDHAHRLISDEDLRARLDITRRSCELYRTYLAQSGEKYLSGDVTSQMYEIMTNHMLLGSDEALRYWKMTVDDYGRAVPNRGVKLLWIHTIPFAQPPVRALLNCNTRARIVAFEMSYESMIIDEKESDPYLAMARRMVYSAFNGDIDHRIEQVLRVQKLVHADGAVFFGHWGCKATLASSPMVKKALEEKGLPCLSLDGDGCDIRNQGDGQTQTRLQAFIEMLEAKR
jgi:benzoyl-CoA reductase/2-hydroxyglutaryl-CoA dehydratase subunit BcrC/BadD/HgdB